MTIDNVMLGAVRHYLMGRVSVARLIHSEIAETGRTLDHITSSGTLGGNIDSANQSFLHDCREMLKDPVPEQYSHTPNYHLKPEDRKFLTELGTKGEEADWRKPEEIDALRLYIDEYAPHGGFGSNQ